MSSEAHADTGVRLEAVAALVAERNPGAQAARFARALLDKVDVAELAGLDTSELAEQTARAFAEIERRAPGEAKIAVRQATIGETRAAILDIVHDDMPFLLDSVLGKLREMGLRPEIVAHPIFRVERGPGGELRNLEVASDDGRGGLRESFIHMQLPHLDSEQAGEVRAAVASVLADVRITVADFSAMRARLNEAIADFEKNPPAAAPEVLSESVDFLKWIGAGNFIFLGVREYRFEGDEQSGELSPLPQSGLGLLRDPAISVLRRGGEARRLTPASRDFFLNSPPVIVAKANSRSTVHRRAHMDTIGIKLYGEHGKITGELRFAGLFTATTFNISTRRIPLLRLKVEQVMRQSGHAPDSFSGRALINFLETFPREELFQISVDQLTRISGEVLKMDLTPRPRVFVRRDEFGRFLSVFVYVPRERYNTQVRERVISLLEESFGGVCEAFTPFFSENAMVRLHILIWRRQVDLRQVEEAELEREVEKIVRTWRDDLRDRLAKVYGEAAPPLLKKYGRAFPLGYEETNSPARAIEDIRRLEKLNPEQPADIDLYEDERSNLRATLLQLEKPVSLSRRVPILENLGFNVISERTFSIRPEAGGRPLDIYLHDSEISTASGQEIDIQEHADRLESGFLAVWHGRTANDRFNGLILGARLGWREAALIRAYAAWLRQTGQPYGLAYVAQVLNKHPAIVARLVGLFHTLFDPDRPLDQEEREEKGAELSREIEAALDAIPVLDEDRVLRRFLSMIRSTMRTNFYQRGSDGGAPETIAFKFRSRAIDWLPAPKPYAEIFVYSNRFEGVHLRGGPIARGGLRWSDRTQDFRTEILGLAKAQQVKNTVIVPVGAKGGFVPKMTLNGASREQFQAEGVACYRAFVSSLLSLTDNLVQGEIVPPERTIRRDGDDPYLVVAADKGTATFSDIANEISLQHDFWLGDAFASGGSAGYDHKKMGITARGAWEAVKRHFREMNIDIQTQPFTVAGVGDMSGDVFGNGMLQSKAIRLVAAFDHRDIFIDPSPDPLSSWEERQGLFAMGRSSWQDYDRARLSEGGGIYSRAAKSIDLSPQAQSLLGLGPQATPHQIISAILKADVDLLWFGGIGTYVRASTETDAQVGDRANDAVRVTGAELRAKVVGEGANLAMTQAARIEYALNGGRLNTDAIDNSAGVNSSDYEVNIKIAFGAALKAGKITLEERNRILDEMTDEVAEAVLTNNYRQTLAISQGRMQGLSDLGFQQQLMRKLEGTGLLDRALEGLPSDAALVERRAAGRPLTRPELAVLLAYAKLDLNASLSRSSAPDDPHLARELFDYFPRRMREEFATEIANHPLRREIIATGLTNDIINRGGSTFIVRLEQETGHGPGAIALAYAAAKEVYGLDALYAQLDALDNRIDGQRQLEMYRDVRDLLRRQTAWFLRHGNFANGLEPEIARYRAGVDYLAAHMADVLMEDDAKRLKECEAALIAEGVQPDCAVRLAALAPLQQALDIVMVANSASAETGAAARTIFAIRHQFHLHELMTKSEALGGGDHFDRLAVNSTIAGISAAQRALAIASLSGTPSGFDAWRERHLHAVERVTRNISEILEGESLTLAKLTVAVAQLRDLARI